MFIAVALVVNFINIVLAIFFTKVLCVAFV